MRAEFSKQAKREMLDRAKGLCEGCGAPYRRPEFHHLYGAHSGKATAADGQVLCAPCHKAITVNQTIPLEAKIKRVRDRHRGIRKRSGFRGWRKFNGDPVRNPRY